MKIGSLCVTKYNMGDSTETAIPTAASIKTIGVGTTCGSATDYTTKCCWQGATSGTNCNSTNGDYSGCSRTVCNWIAGNAICANFKYGNKTWRLPNASDMTNWLSYSSGKGNNGLMLCNLSSGYSSAYCYSLDNGCPGSSSNNCDPYRLWTSAIKDYRIAYYYTLDGNSWTSRTLSGRRSAAYSIRCITDM